MHRELAMGILRRAGTDHRQIYLLILGQCHVEKFFRQ
jgi:hypothetical protein